MFGDIIKTGLEMLPGVKAQVNILEITDSIDPIWKTKTQVGIPTEIPATFYFIHDESDGLVTQAGIDENELTEFVAYTPLKLGQKFVRLDTNESYEIREFETVPTVSKEMFIGKARKITSGG